MPCIPPPAVIDATDSYLVSEDAFEAWIADCCERGKTAWESSATLFASWKVWAERNSEYVGTIRRFAQALERHGITFLRKNKARGCIGLRLVGDAQ
jgi:putative DNA primase/helicase